MAARAAGLPAAITRTTSPSRPGAPLALGARWRPAADYVHGMVAIAALAGVALIALAWPAAGAALQTRGGALLLVGGALIGVPHGSSDFVVAHRLMRPALGWRWLPAFLLVYLALVAVTMAAWALVPLATLLGFLAISGLHFGWGDLRASTPMRHPALAFAVRAATPVLPIFLIHPEGVAGFVAALGGVETAGVLDLLHALRWPLLLPWALALAAVTLPPLFGRRDGATARDAGELLAVALAAAALPPLLAFGLYFCLVHAVRHMLELAEDRHPTHPRAAAMLVAAVIAPSALACLAALALTWADIAGLFDTAALVTWGLRIVAALTVPHMALEWMAARRIAPAPRPEPMPCRQG